MSAQNNTSKLPCLWWTTTIRGWRIRASPCDSSVRWTV